MNKKWKLKQNDENRISDISKKFNLTYIVAQKLAEKDLTDKEIEIFLNPTRKDFHNPFKLPDMEVAVNRILKAMENKEKIVIYGDYDADGITSTTILKRFFGDRGIEVGTYIPNRLDEGYGLNEEAIKEIANEGYNLMITVDCGITAVKEVELAKSLGIDVIITDHHEVPEELPKATAVVDAKRKDNEYPFNGLAGCGVAFKLTQALSIKLNLNENEWLKYIDIACIGTISDIVPLIDENRVIAKLGLMLVAVTKNIGLKTLISMIGIKKIDSTFVSFGISPRINACGRMGHQEDALNLFLTNDPIEARNLAIKLEEYNRQRQEIEKNIYNEALELISKEKDEPCIVLGKEGWHHGVIGIVSSKVTDITYKPSILVCFEGENSKGSGRSIQGFDLHEAVYNCKDYLTACGGHSMAIGLSLKTKDFEPFKKAIIEYAKTKNIENLEPELLIDEEINSSDISISGIDKISLLEPFGESNSMPIVLYKNLKIISIRTLSEGKHLKLVLIDGNNYIDAIGFSMGDLAEKYQIGDKVDIVGNISVNRYKDLENVQITLKDMRTSI